MSKPHKIALLGSNSELLAKIADVLSARYSVVRIVSEFQDSQTALETGQADTLIFDANEPKSLICALNGVDVIILTSLWKVDSLDVIADLKVACTSLIDATRKIDKVKIINISSVGAHLEREAGLLECFRLQELSLNRLDNAEIYHLRTGYLLDNFFESIARFAGSNILYGFLEEEIPFFFSTHKDVALLCLQILERDVEVGHIHIWNVRHENLISPRQITDLLATDLCLSSVKYEKFGVEDAIIFLLDKGLVDLTAKKELEMYKAFYTATCVLEVLRGETKTSKLQFSDFAFEFAKRLSEYNRRHTLIHFG